MSADLVITSLAGGHAHRTLFESLDLTVAPGDVVGVVGANGAGKTTLLRILAGDLEPLDGVVSTAPERRLRRLAAAGARARRRARPSRGTSPAAPGPPPRPRRWSAAATGLATHSRAAEDAYAHSLDHWQASGAPDLDERLPPVLADLGLDVDAGRPDDLAVRRAGRPGRAGRPAAQPLRRGAARRAHQRPRPRRPGAAGGVRAAACAAAWCWSPTTASSSPGCVTRIVELDLAQGRVAVYDGGYDAFLEERAIARRHAREAYEEFADTQGRPGRSRPGPSGSGARQGVRNAMKKSPDNDKIRRKAPGGVVREAGPEGAPDGVADRPARRGRGAAQGVGAAVHHRQRRPAPARSSRRSTEATVSLGGFTFGPVSLQVSARRPDRHHRPQRRRQDDPAAAAARPARARTPAAPAWAPRWRSARSTRPAPGWPTTCPWATPSRRRCRG